MEVIILPCYLPDAKEGFEVEHHRSGELIWGLVSYFKTITQNDYTIWCRI